MNVSEPIQIAPGVWWIGYVIKDDPFQCHVYFIENGENSIMIDPGSKITWPVTKKKIEKITSLDNIRYIITHHQDPDITSCIEDLSDEIGVKNRYVVTHWRTATLLKHYNWGVEFYLVDQQEWRLQAGELELEFIFTPYMHFPGAICTYFAKERILFSSDIFGALTPKFSLWAEDAKEYFDYMKPFHTHYMPSREIVNFGLDNIEKKEIDLIAPQHGSIIKKELIHYIINALRKLDVGLFLEFLGSYNVQKLSKAHDIVSKAYDAVIYASESMYECIGDILSLFGQIYAVERIVCFAFEGEKVLIFDSLYPIPKEMEDTRSFYNKIDLADLRKEPLKRMQVLYGYQLSKEYFIYQAPVFNDQKQLKGLCFILFEEFEIFDKDDLEILNSFHKVLSLMLLKELSVYHLEKEKRMLMYRVITDALTEVYSRSYFEELFPKEIDKAQRHEYPLSIAMIDLDHFKMINDTYGHDVGDLVLKDFAKMLKNTLRESDLVFRYGGEEFVVILPFTDSIKAKEVIERVRGMLHSRGGIYVANEHIRYDFSAGIAQLKKDEYPYELLKRADMTLYEAKKRRAQTLIDSA